MLQPCQQASRQVCHAVDWRHALRDRHAVPAWHAAWLLAVRVALQTSHDPLEKFYMIMISPRRAILFMHLLAGTTCCNDGYIVHAGHRETASAVECDHMHEALLQQPTCPTNKGAGGRWTKGGGAEVLLRGCPAICPATCPCPCTWAGAALCAGSTELLPKVAAPGMGSPLGGWDPGGGGVPGFPLMALTRPAEKGRLPPPKVLRGGGPFSAAGCSTKRQDSGHAPSTNSNASQARLPSHTSFLPFWNKSAYQVGDAPGEGLARGRPGVGQLLVVVHPLVGGD